MSKTTEGQDKTSDSRMLDVAKGVLVAARRCTVDEAFDELVATAKRYQVGVFALSVALVDLANDPAALHTGLSAEVARRTWSGCLSVAGTAIAEAG